MASTPNSDAGGFALTLPPDALKPLVASIIREVLAQLEGVRATVPDKLAFTETEAARLLSLNTHQLRDERLRGRISASQIVGRRIAYRREDLIAYLADRPFVPRQAARGCEDDGRNRF